MGLAARVDIRVPARIVAGDVVDVRTRLVRPRGSAPIDRMAATYRAATLAVFETVPGVSVAPFCSFTVRATEPGPLTVTFHDTAGRTYEGTVAIALA